MTNVILATITAYCACSHCTPGHGVTAAGTRPVQGTTIAGPMAYRLLSRVVIDGHRFVLEDRTAKRFDGRFDIYFSSHSAARRFGIRTNLVTIITPP